MRRIDKIREMTDEDLFRFLLENNFLPKDLNMICPICCGNHDCDECIKNWLFNEVDSLELCEICSHKRICKIKETLLDTYNCEHFLIDLKNINEQIGQCSDCCINHSIVHL